MGRFVSRIVLSVAVGALLSWAACAPDDANRGIGTSPSGPGTGADDDPVAPTLLDVTVPQPCGIWIAASADEADAAARAGAEPDVLVFTRGHLTCADALRLSSAWWPGASMVRYATQGGWKAVLAP